MHRSRLTATALAPLLSVTGALAYARFPWVRFGEALVLHSNQRVVDPAMWGERLARHRWGWPVVSGSGSLMVLMAMGFARSWYLT